MFAYAEDFISKLSTAITPLVHTLNTYHSIVNTVDPRTLLMVTLTLLPYAVKGGPSRKST